LLEPIAANGLTDSAVQAAVKKEYFANQFTVIPHDGDKVTVGAGDLIGTPSTPRTIMSTSTTSPVHWASRPLTFCFGPSLSLTVHSRSGMCGWLSAPMPPPYGGSTAKK
jgi:hypothetical protein